MPQWVFKQQQPGDTTRNPISGEFFSTEAIRNSAEALVREGIQNSLDAARDGEQVRVALTLSGVGKAARPSDVAPFMHGLDGHLLAAGNGLSTPPNPAADCPFLTFEDFGTTGLEGDPAQWHPVEDGRNGFFAFFRAEGQSNKGESERGRWGVGKFVFPRASQGSAFFGLTIRASDGRAMLMGRTILKTHSIGNARYVPDGYFGEPRAVGGGSLVMPIEDPALIDAFRRSFCLQRTTQPGLSLVIPWYDRDITQAQIVDAIVRDWFFSVLTGDLVVSIRGDEGEQVLSSETLDTFLQGAEPVLQRDLLPLVELARFARNDAERLRVTLGSADTSGSAKWHDGMLDPERLAAISQTLDRGEMVAVRIPIAVHPKRGAAESSHFDIFLRRDVEAGDVRPVFVRDGIIVSDAKGRIARGHRAIVNIDDRPLATLLGDAENPSHTEWRSDTAHFKEKYRYGPGYLTLVKNSVGELVARLHAAEQDEAPDLLLDMFYEPREPDPAAPKPTPKPGGKPGGSTVEPPEPPKPKPAKYRLSEIKGGFSIGRGSPEARTPDELHVTVAYDVRRGNPFKKYDSADFQLLKGPVKLVDEPRGLAVIESSGNRLRLKVTNPDFHLSMGGFDLNRDLIVRVVAKDAANDDSTDQLD